MCRRGTVVCYFYVTFVFNSCYGKLAVRPSVCMSVTLMYRAHIGWNSSQIMSRLVSYVCSLCAEHNVTDLLQGEHPDFAAGIGVGHGRKVAFSVQKL